LVDWAVDRCGNTTHINKVAKRSAERNLMPDPPFTANDASGLLAANLTLVDRNATELAKSTHRVHCQYSMPDRNRNGVSTELTALFSAELRRGRSDRDSSPWSTQPRSLSRTP